METFYDAIKKDNLDIKIIASTRVDLDHMVKKGYLRKDLYYRLNVLRIEIPQKTNVKL